MPVGQVDFETNWQDWCWDVGTIPLCEYCRSPPSFGFYEIGMIGADGDFRPHYAGRAAGSTIFSRLSAHYHGRGNRSVFMARESLSYRYKVCATEAMARYVEALHIAAISYRWNRRMEWTQHWALHAELWDPED